MQEALSVGLGTATALTAAAATYYLVTRPEPYIPALDLQKQSVILKDGSRASPFVTDGQLLGQLYEDVTTAYEGFRRGIRVSNNGPCLGSRTGPNKEYEWLSYQEVHDKAQAFGSGIQMEGVEPGNKSFIGIYSSNRTEWVLTEQACNMFSMVSVPLYDTLGVTACHFIINQIGLTHIVVDKSDKAMILLKDISQMKSIKCIVLMDPISENCRKTAEKHGIKLLHFENVVNQGLKNLKDPMPPKPEDLITICYTSGTTGDPKGVMLTHANIMTNMACVAFVALKCINITPSDVHLSYLPLAHMFERGMQCLGYMHGIQVGFSQGDVKLLTDDLLALRPTLFITVPRLLNRMYDKVLAGVQGSKLKTKLLEYALSSKTKEIQCGVVRNDSIWDKILFSKIQQRVGGRVKILITGSAPLEPKVLNFVRAAFGCFVLEGYGQTECTAGVTFNIPGEFQAGNVGGPLPCCHVKLVDVSEMNYYAKDNKGEVCVKGLGCSQGYYKNPEKTKETIDEEGWLHTGDIGEWLPNGTLRIIDRKKNIFKLAQGEYVAAEKIENVYLRSEYIAQAFVEGDSLKPYLMGVVVPDEEVVLEWAKQEGLPTNMKELCTSQKLKNLMLKDMLAVGKSMGLKTFEQVKDIHLFPEMFSVENNLLTPTFKNRRPNLRTYFKQVVVDLYNKHEA